VGAGHYEGRRVCGQKVEEMSDYPLEWKPEIFEETVYVVHDPMIAQDIATFSSEKDAKRFAKSYYKRDR